MLVVYENDGEVIVATKEKEPELIRDYFAEGGRYLEEYDRREVPDGVVAVTSRMASCG